MSNSKKIRNRLDQLFTGIKEPEVEEGLPTETKGKPVSTPATAASPTVRKPSLHTGMLSPAPMERMSNVTVAEAGQGSSATIMSIPFQSGDEWNLIQLEKESPQRWKDEDQALVRQVVDQLGLALQNAQLFQQTERQNTNLAVLNEMGRELATQLNIGQVVQTAYKFISQLMDTSSFFIALLNSDNESLTFPLVTVNGRRIEYPERKLGSGLTDYVLRTQKPQLLNGNVTAQMQTLGIEFLPLGNAEPAVSWLGAPLIIGNKTLGAIVVQSTQTPYLYTEQSRDLLVAVASQAAISLQNAQLFLQTEEQKESLEVLNEMGRELTSLRSIPQIAESLHKYTSRLMDGKNFFLALHNPTANLMDLVNLIINNKQQAPQSVGLDGITGWVFNNKKPLLMSRDVDAKSTELGIEHVLLPGEEDDRALSWLGVPLLLGDQILGALVVQSLETEGLFKERERDLLIAIASQAAISIQNARLFDETQKRTQDLATLNDIVRAVSGQIELKQVLEVVYQEVRKLIPLDVFFVGLYDEKTRMVDFPLVIDDQVYYNETPTPINPKNLTGQAILSGKTLQKTLTPEEAAATNEVDGTIGNTSKLSGSLLFIPLKSGQKTIGCLSIQSYTLSAYLPESVTLIENVSNQISTAIQNARLYEQEQKRRQISDGLNEMARIANSTLNLKDVARLLLEQMPLLLPFNTATLQLTDEKGHREQVGGISFQENRQQAVETPKEEFLRPVQDDPLINEVFTSKKTVFISDTQDDPRWEVHPETEHIRSWMCSPLITGEKVIGFLILDNDSPNIYHAETAALVDSISIQAAGAIQNATLFDETQRRNYELAVINELIRETAQSLDADAICKSAYKYVSQLMDTKSFYIALYDEKRKMRHVPLIYDEGQPFSLEDNELDNGATSWVIRNNKPLFLPANAPELAKEYGCEFVILGNSLPPKSWLGVPIPFGDRALGALVVQSTSQNNLFTEHHRDLLVSIAGQIAIILENVRLYNQEQYRRSVADALSDMARIAGSSLDLNEIVNRLLSETPRLLNFRTAIIQLVGKEDRLEQVGAIRIDDAGTAHEVKTPKERSSAPVQDFPLLNELHEKREPIFIADTTRDQRWQKTTETAEVRSWLGAPLIVSNRVIGLLLLHDDKPNAYNEDSAVLARSIAAQVASSIFNTQLFKQSQDRARREQLLREITARVRGSTDPDSILRTVVREVGQAFGLQTFINIGSPTSAVEKTPAQISGQPTMPADEVSPQPGGKAGRRKTNQQPPKAEGGK